MSRLLDNFRVGDHVIIPGVYEENWKCHARIMDIAVIDPERESMKIVVNKVTDFYGENIDPGNHGYTNFLLGQTMELEHNIINPINISKEVQIEPVHKISESEYKTWLNRYFDIRKHEFPSIYYTYYNHENFEACQEYVSKFCKLKKRFGNFTPSYTKRQLEIRHTLK